MSESPFPESKWVQQSLQLPDHIADRFREYAKASPAGVKHCGTAAIAVFMGLPPYARDEVVKSAFGLGWVGPEGISEYHLAGVLFDLMLMVIETAQAEGVRFDDSFSWGAWFGGQKDDRVSVKQLSKKFHEVTSSESGVSARRAMEGLVEVDPKKIPKDLPPGTKVYIDRILDPEILGGPKARGPVDTGKIPKGKKSG